ncbi:MAG: RNA methyltransferase [Candidatus Sumerlaeia bacterium]|nr:RNA methyltransferase [Candidatus Sumerlaeia bacterium]
MSTDFGNFRTPERGDRLRRVIEWTQPGLAVVVENIHDPHNIAAIMRSCDAVGARQLHLLYNEESFPNFSRTGKKSSSGARKWLQRHKHRTVEGCFSTLRERGYRILTSTLADDAVSLYDLDLTKPVAIVLGNENRGASEEACRDADTRFMIPMMGMVQSLNVSVAAAVTLYEAMRQRRAAGMYDAPQMEEPLREELLQEWLRK